MRTASETLVRHSEPVAFVLDARPGLTGRRGVCVVT
jgi:hypothetical protein